jgi:NADH dehydrogenase
MNSTQTHIIVLGGGFAGIGAIKTLLKKHDPHIKITLIDKNPYHLFTPSLYEVATRETPQKNIAIPFTEIFGHKISYIKDSIKHIDTKKKNIQTESEIISYDYLLFALGSEPAYHKISGLEKYSIPLKSLSDALNIQKQISSLYQVCKLSKEKLNLVIGGGGFAGTELATELLTYKHHLEENNHNDCVRITILHGGDRLLPELDSHVSVIAKKRLSDPCVQFAFGGHITEVTKEIIKTDTNQTYPYDLFIWTGGVQTNHLATTVGLPLTDHGQITVDTCLQASDSIFVAGDCAGFIDPITKRYVPGVAQVAEEEGLAAGENIYRLIKKQPLVPYNYRHFGYIIPLKGKFAAAELMSFHFDGLLGWALQQVVFFRYLLGILPLTKAIKRWNTFEMELSQ